MALAEREVRERLAVLCPPDTYPELGPADLDAMVRIARRADALGFPPDDYQPWPGPGVGLPLGALAVPSDRDGYVYRVAARSGDGRTGATEPIWTAGAPITDNELTWAVWDTAPWTPTWHINAGAARGWRLKAGKAAGRYNFSAGTDRFDVNQVVQNCLAMARQYEGGGMARLRAGESELDVLQWREVLGN